MGIEFKYHRVIISAAFLNLKQGDVIKEGQVIGYLDQFGSELPVKVTLFISGY